MANKKVTELSAIASLATGDVQHIVDVSDTTDDPTGSSRQMTIQQLANLLASLAMTLTNKTLTAPVINSPTGLTSTDVSLGNVSNVAQLPLSYLDTDVTLAANSDVKVPSQKAVKAYADTVRGVTASETATLTNKRITKRVASATSTGTITPNADTTDLLSITAQGVTGAFQAPSGTPTDGQGLIIRIKDNATARALTWATGTTGGYTPGGVDLPSTTVTGKYLHLGFLYVTANSLNKWMLIASAQEA